MFEYLTRGEPSSQLLLSMARRWPSDEMSLQSSQSLSVKWINKTMSDTYKLVWLTSKHTKLNKLLLCLISKWLLGPYKSQKERLLLQNIFYKTSMEDKISLISQVF